ncbi:MAG: class I SAM-dependent methyltransferase [Candidatus Pacebacteria bacterium]|nr:class I SAM-dependent methyltransferase [Candidatus Paceibacterota bacterium]
MFSDPAKNIEQLELTRNMVIADLGSGTGFYTIAAAKKIKGGDGRVYSVEVQRELLQHIQEMARKESLNNIDYIWGNIEKRGGTKIHDKIIDCAIVSNVLFQVEDRQGFIAELKRILKPEGKVLLIDWSESYGGMGPAQANVINAGAAQSLFESAGFTKLKTIEAGAHHYGIILKL